MSEELSREAADRELMERVAAREQAAFSEMYDRLSGPLYSLALRMLADAGEAEDVLQDVFMQIWRRAPSYDPMRSSVFTWAVHIARCKIIDSLRARGRRLRVLMPAGEELPEDPPDASTPSAGADAVSRSERAASVRRGLIDLPPDQRQAIEMAFLSDLTHHEIASRLGQPLGTVKARIRRGLLKLRDSLNHTL